MFLSKGTKQSILQGSLILIAGMIIVKIIGAIFKIPMTALITEGGMAYFLQAYNLFIPIQTIAIAGFPVAISKMVAESIATKRYNDVKKIYSVSMKVFIVTGTIGTLIMLFGAKAYVNAVNTPDALYAILVMSPSIFFCCMMSINRGYFTGLQNMTPTAVSQIIEALSKLILGLLFANLVINIGLSQYESTGIVYGQAVQSIEMAKKACLPFAAAAAIAGVTLGTVFGTIYLFVVKKWYKNYITKEQYRLAPKADTGKNILKSMLAIGIPVALGALANNLSTLIDTVSLSSGLMSALETDPGTIRTMFEGYILPSDTNQDIQNFLYGSYFAIALTMFNLVPTITTSFGVSALPEVTASWALKDKEKTKRSIESVLRMTSLIAIPAGLGLTILAKPILNVVFHNNLNGAAVSIALLQVLGIAVVFVSLVAPIESMLQAVGKASLVVVLLVITAIIKLIFNVILIPNPEINVYGAPWGTLVSYMFLFASQLYFLCRVTKIKINYLKTFIKPLFSSAVCIIATFLANLIMQKVFSETPDTDFKKNIIILLICMLIALIFYVATLLITRTIDKNDIIMLPKGKKIAKVLEKHNLIS